MAFYDGLKQDETNLYVTMFVYRPCVPGSADEMTLLFIFSDILCKEEDGRVSLAYERLPGIPKNLADKFALRTHTLDLSYNNIK